MSCYARDRNPYKMGRSCVPSMVAFPGILCGSVACMGKNTVLRPWVVVTKESFNEWNWKNIKKKMNFKILKKRFAK